MDADDNTYGQITERGTFKPTRTILGPTPDTDGDSNAFVTITWSGLNFTKAGQTFIVDIEKLKVREKGGAVEFTTKVNDVEVEKSPKLYITDSQDGAVEFEIDGATYTSFSAGQEVPSIKFTFGAVSTAIKDGQVKFTLPEWLDCL